MRRALLAAAVLVLGIGASGCASRVGYSYVRVAPPPPRHEVIGYAPGPGFVWVSGHYAWRPRGGYYWTPGRWVRPPRKHAQWQSGRWEWTPHGYRWREGRWR